MPRGSKPLECAIAQRVHLAPLLLAVPDPVDARRLLEAHAVPARPAGDLVRVALVGLEELDQLLVALDADLLAPDACVLDVALLERLAGGGLDEPRRLRQRADLVCQELDVAIRAHAAASVVAVFALPRRATFSRATASETYWRSPFGTSATSSIPRASQLPDEGRDLARLLGRGAASVEHACQEPLAEALGDRADLRRVEVHADRVDGQVAEPALECALRVAERQPERELRAAREQLERVCQPVEAGFVVARQERLLEHDELGFERVELRLQDAFGHRDRGERRCRARTRTATAA